MMDRPYDKRRMADQPMPATRDGRDWWIALALVVAVILFRAAIFVFWERSHFDSDQAITGLMAKHLAEGRAFPVFWYGQSYMLAVESWLAAPLFLVFGTSVTALKLPMLAMNFAIASAAARVRPRGRAAPLIAVVPTLFFALPAAGTAARLVEANGGNVEPFLYVLLIWTLRYGRSGAAWCSAWIPPPRVHALRISRPGPHRTRAARRSSPRRRAPAARQRRGRGRGMVFVQWIKQFSSGAGPGTSLADVYRPNDNITELANRVCVDPQTAASGLLQIGDGTLAGALRSFPNRCAISRSSRSHRVTVGGVLLGGVR